jgi:hypothetical protein
MPVENLVVNMKLEATGQQTVDAVVDKMVEGQQEVKNEVKQTNDAFKVQEGVIDSAGGAMAEYAGKVKDVGKATTGAFGAKALKDFEKAGVQAFKNVVIGASKSGAAFKSVGKDIKAGIGDALKAAGVSVDDFNQALKEAGVTADDFAASIVQTAFNTEEIVEAFEAVDRTGMSLKTRLKELKDQLSLMEDAGLEGTAMFETMAIEAGSLEDQLGDTAARIRTLSSDTQNIDAAVEGVQVMASGFQVAAGAAAVFGAEDENLQKVMVKLNGIMAITTGIQQLMNFLHGQSSLRLKLAAADNALFAMSNRVTAATLTMVGSAATATSVTFKVLRTVMMTLGIGLIIAAIGFLVDMMMTWSDETETAEDAQARLETQTQKTNEAIKDQTDALDDLNETNKLRAKLAGASEEQLFRIEQKGIQDRINIRNKAINDAINSKSKEIIDTTELIKANNADLNLLENNRLNHQIDLQQEAADKSKKIGEDAAKDKEKKAKEDEEREQRQVDALDTINKNALQKQINNNKEILSNTTLNQEVRNNAEKDHQIKQIELANLEKEILLRNKELGATEILLIEEETNQKIEDINKEHAANILKIWQDSQKNQVDLKKAPDIVDATDEQLKSQFASMMTVTTENAEKEIKTIEDTEKKKAETRKAAAAATISAVTEAANALFEAGAERRQKELDDALAKNQAAMEGELNNKNLTEQQKDDIAKKYAAKERLLKIAAFNDDKKAKRTAAIINGLLGITNALATAPTIIAGVILAASVAATTAIAVAKIQAAQPGFKKGGYTGNKRKDEVAGFVHGQEYVAHAEAYKRYKPALEAMNDLKFEDYIKRIAPVYSMPQMVALPETINGQPLFNIDYDRIGIAVAKHSDSKPRMIMNADANGLSIFMQEKNNITKIQNKRYSL